MINSEWDEALKKLVDSPENNHDFVQILFPNRNASKHANEHVFLGQGDDVIKDLIQSDFQSKLKDSLPKMLSHWGFKIDSTGNVTLDSYKFDNTKKYVIIKNHNQLRITRVLECLRLFKGNDTYLKTISESFYKQLCDLDINYDNLSDAFSKWTSAHFG